MTCMMKVTSSVYIARHVYNSKFIDCGLNEDCVNLNRPTRRNELFDSLATGGTFGLSKRLGRYRITNRDDPYAKRRGGLDSLVPGGMFGKAAKRSSIRDEEKNSFQRNMRYLNTMDLGGSFGKAAEKRFSLDTLGNNAFGVEKRTIDENTDQDQKAFQLSSGNKNRQRFDTYQSPQNYFNLDSS